MKLRDPELREEGLVACKGTSSAARWFAIGGDLGSGPKILQGQTQNQDRENDDL